MSKLKISFSNTKEPTTLFKKSVFEESYQKTGNYFSTPIPALGYFNAEDFDIPNTQITRREYEDVSEVCADDITLLRITHEEKKYIDLENASYHAYKKIFEYLSNNTDMNLLRIWNYIPHILRHDNLERYREFNVGRWNAWQESGPKFSDGTPKRPAATGIGSFDGPLIVEALFTKYPVIYLENPRQTQFIHYSEKWGVRPPISARGTAHMHPDGVEVYIAGTASLLGEEVAHVGDVVEQTYETLRNIQALISGENLMKYEIDAHFDLINLEGIRVYIKNPDTDFSRIKSILEKELPDKDILYVHDDICRPGFLIEIEAVAR